MTTTRKPVEAYTQEGFYTYPQETWTAAQCEKACKHSAYGGPKGLIASSSAPYAGYGTCIRFNGGCVREGKWYAGEQRPLPIIPEGYYFERVSSWGLFIRKEDCQ